MNQLKEKELMLDSKEVAEMVGKRHDNLLRDINNYAYYLTSSKLRSLNFFIADVYIDGKGEERSCFQITKKGCEFIAHKMTGQKGTEFTATYINRFHEMENQLTSQNDSYRIGDPIQRAKKWIQEWEEKQELIEQVKKDKPKVIFADAVSASKTSILVGELAKLLRQNDINTGQNRLFEWLRNNGYLIRRNGTDYNMPTQRSMEMELFEVKETSITHSDGHISVSKTPKITGKGQVYFINKFKNMGLVEVN